MEAATTAAEAATTAARATTSLGKTGAGGKNER
jgi:hypothetical protein